MPSGLLASNVNRTGATAVAGVNSFDSVGFTSVNAVNLGQYLSLTLVPTGGGILDLNSISFNLNRDQQGPKKAELRSSLDGFAAPLGATISLTPNAAGTLLTATGLTGGFDTITGPAGVEFRVYGYDATQTSGVMNLFDGNSGGTAVSISGGFAPVPEPLTVGLAAAAGLGLVRVVRRRVV